MYGGVSQLFSEVTISAIWAFRATVVNVITPSCSVALTGPGFFLWSKMKLVVAELVLLDNIFL